MSGAKHFWCVLVLVVSASTTNTPPSWRNLQWENYGPDPHQRLRGLFVQAALESGQPSWSLSYGSSVPIIEYTDVRKPKSVSLPSRIHQLTPQCVVHHVR